MKLTFLNRTSWHTYFRYNAIYILFVYAGTLPVLQNPVLSLYLIPHLALAFFFKNFILLHPSIILSCSLLFCYLSVQAEALMGRCMPLAFLVFYIWNYRHLTAVPYSGMGIGNHHLLCFLTSRLPYHFICPPPRDPLSLQVFLFTYCSVFQFLPYAGDGKEQLQNSHWWWNWYCAFRSIPSESSNHRWWVKGWEHWAF